MTQFTPSAAFTTLLALTLSAAWAETKKVVEGPLEPFLGKPQMKMQQVFKSERMPNIVVTMKGTLVATWGTKSVRTRRSEDGGKTWSPEITIANPGFQGGGTTVNEANGDILTFVEDRHPPAPLTVYRSCRNLN